jgi:ABC-type lipoprotein release transport system permease subunit
MDINSDSATIVASFFGVGSSVMCTAISWGVMKNKIQQVEKDIEQTVRHDVFDATIKPLQEDIHEMRKDLKQLLKEIQKRNFQPIRDDKEDH